MFSNFGSARYFNKCLPYTFVLLQKILICGYRGVVLSNNLILFRKFFGNFFAITRAKYDHYVYFNVYQLDVSQYCYFEFMNPRASKVLVHTSTRNPDKLVTLGMIERLENSNFILESKTKIKK